MGSKGIFEDVTLDFTVTDHSATIGAVGGKDDGSYDAAGYWWYKVDNFRLYFLGNEMILDETAKEVTFEEDFYTKVTLKRSLKENTWSTFVVPFDMETPAGWEVKELTGINVKGDLVSLVFTSADAIMRGTPYMATGRPLSLPSQMLCTMGICPKRGTFISSTRRLAPSRPKR